MKKINLLLAYLLIFFLNSFGNDFLVSTSKELAAANSLAKPGDQIILKKGEWKNITIQLTCRGTLKNPIIVKPEIEGKTIITGNSMIKLGGSFITVSGFQFINGFAGDDPVISFRVSEKEIANNCRVTNCVIDDFNNSKRLQDNYWISLYGKNNRIDHCSFINKKNLGVLLAIHLDDERSRENFHTIDHNYFGKRIPLASNAGEIIRIGVSEHCQYNSNTIVTDNLFEHCDGEGEIISIKSCQNLISKNVFKECQGSVVLRHGNYNTIESNVFLGNNKEGTGGVRIINKGQYVSNNYFYKCRGEGFRSPLCIMNGVPNSPANRYVEVSEAIIANNSFYECSPASFCEGSDKERSVAPYNVAFINNLFFNARDSALYYSYDDISRIHFQGNVISPTLKQPLPSTFYKAALLLKKSSTIEIPRTTPSIKNKINDSTKLVSNQRLSTPLSDVPGITYVDSLISQITKITNQAGVKNYLGASSDKNQFSVTCKTANDVILAINKFEQKNLTINLSGDSFEFDSPININCNLTITSNSSSPIRFSFNKSASAYFLLLKAGNSLSIKNSRLDLEGIKSKAFITTDTSENPNHSWFSLINSKIENTNSIFFNAALSSVCDSIIVRNCLFNEGAATLFNLQEEKDNKGYYNVEKFIVEGSTFNNRKGTLISVLRSGKDESTLGPRFSFVNNQIKDCTSNSTSLVELRGVQFTQVNNNTFTNCNETGTLIEYEDWVRAWHSLKNNSLIKSGNIKTNQYVNLN